MTYKHQNDAIDAVDFMKPSYGTEKHQEIQKELAEVYRKAEAWDKYKAHMESHIAGEVNEEELVSDLKSDYFESGDHS